MALSEVNVAVGIFAAVILTVCAQIPPNQRLPAITRVSKPQVVSRGDRAVLECHVINVGENTVVWLHVKGPTNIRVLTAGGSTIIQDTRYTVEARDNQYNLEIREVFEGDAGNYVCQISTQNPVSRDVTLNVKIPPVIGEDSSRDMVVIQGSRVRLYCNATGFPKPEMRWLRDDEGSLPTGGTAYIGSVLEIESIQKEDRGIYVCVADNRVGEGDRRAIAVKVEFAPEIITPKPRVGQAINYGLNAELECQVEAYPAPHIIWSKNGEEITNNKDYRTNNFAGGNDVTVSKLTVIAVQALDYGAFDCKATNTQGTSRGQVELFETARPDHSAGGNPRGFIPDGAATTASSIISMVTGIVLTLAVLH